MPSLQLDPAHLDAEAALRWVRAQDGARAFLIYASAPPEQASRGREAQIEECFRDIARGLARDGVRRFVVAGGETSGAVVEALGVRALAIGPEIDPGVPWTAAADGSPYQLALKSGNFGAPDFFLKAIA
jgi:3-dehydrotetronate 4-kinase